MKLSRLMEKAHHIVDNYYYKNLYKLSRKQTKEYYELCEKQWEEILALKVVIELLQSKKTQNE